MGFGFRSGLRRGAPLSLREQAPDVRGHEIITGLYRQLVLLSN